jgi:hypothetical protein
MMEKPQRDQIKAALFRADKMLFQDELTKRAIMLKPT